MLDEAEKRDRTAASDQPYLFIYHQAQSVMTDASSSPASGSLAVMLATACLFQPVAEALLGIAAPRKETLV